MDDKAKLQYINKRSVKGNVREDYYLSGTSRAHDKVAIPYHRPSPRDDAPQSTHVERFLDSWHRRHGSNSCWSDTC